MKYSKRSEVGYWVSYIIISAGVAVVLVEFWSRNIA